VNHAMTTIQLQETGAVIPVPLKQGSSALGNLQSAPLLFAGTELLILLKHVMTGTQKTETGAALNVPLNASKMSIRTLRA